MPRDQLLGRHREEISVDKAREVEEDLADRERVDLERESARRPDAALDGFGELTEVIVTGIRSAHVLIMPMIGFSMSRSV